MPFNSHHLFGTVSLKIGKNIFNSWSGASTLSCARHISREEVQQSNIRSAYMKTLIMYVCTVKFVFWPLGGILAEHVYVDLVGFWVCPRKTSCFLQRCSHVTLDCFWNSHKFKCRLLKVDHLKKNGSHSMKQELVVEVLTYVWPKWRCRV